MNAQQLRNSILQEAIEGRLVPQDPNDEPASVLLERIREEKKRLVKEGKLKKKDLEEIPISEDEKLFEIPESWEWVRIKAILSLQAGKNVTSADIHSEQNGVFKYPCYGGNGLRGYVKNYNNEGSYPLIGRQGALCGNVNMAHGQFWATEHAVVTDGWGMTDVKWQYFFLIALNLNRYATATAQPGLAVSNIIEVPIPLPPLAEQKRIVAKIEELLPKVEEYGKAQDALNKLNEELPERLKKSILQEAIEGRLVPQDPNDEPASVLLDKIRAEKKRLVKEGKLKKKDLEETPIEENEIPFKIPESWEWCKLGTIAALIGGFAFKSHEYTSSGSRVIRISDITENGFINKNVVRFPFTDKLSQYVILEGDILMAMTGGTVGKSLYVKYLPEETMLLNQRVALIRPNIVFTDYIDYVIKSQHIQGIITEAKNSTNDNISMGDLYNFPIPLPPLVEQKRIVAKIEELFSVLDSIKESLE